MKQIPTILHFIFISVIISSCNTLYNTKTVSIEVVVPGKFDLPSEYGTVALRYNNFNVGESARLNQYISRGEILTDTSDTEILASKVYFNSVLDGLRKNSLVDSIVQITPGDFSQFYLSDTLINYKTDSLTFDSKAINKVLSIRFANYMRHRNFETQNSKKEKKIDPEYALYSEEEIQEIADSTGADILLSLDYFNSIDGIAYYTTQNTGVESVFPTVYWNIYNLKTKRLELAYEKMDSISWDAVGYSFRQIKKELPPRKDAVLNAAEISGTEFSELLSPHWIEVDRMYYGSGHTELKQTENLVSKARWIEAAKIWKANIHNPNKSISAKCMFNMGLVCEMEGRTEAALDWVIKSFYVFGQKNEIHYQNCLNYIQILSQRNLDLKSVENQLSKQSDSVEQTTTNK